MHNILGYISLFFFIFSLLGSGKLLINFLSSMLATPPKPFEISSLQIVIHGGLLSYLITYIIYLLS